MTSVPTAEGLRAYRDRTGGLTAEQVSALPSEAFTPTTHPNFSYTRDTVWLAFEVQNPSASPQRFVIDATREWVDDVRLFSIGPSGVATLAETGARVPLLQRPIPIERIALPFDLEAREHKRLLVRISSRSPIAFDPAVQPLASFQRSHSYEQLLMGAYLGILLTLAISSLLLFASLRDKQHLFAAAMLSSLAFGEAASHGVLSSFAPVLSGLSELSFGSLGFGGVVVVLGRWARHILRTREWAPRLEVAATRVDVVAALLCLTAALAPTLHFLTFFGTLSVAGIVLFQAARAIPRKIPGAVPFTLALSLFLVPSSGTITMFLGLLSPSTFIEYATHIGAVSMGCLLSLVIADGLRQERDRVRALGEELRYQVNSRSRELIELLASQPDPIKVPPLKEGDLVGERYRVVRLLGRGGWGAVYEVSRESDGARFALKRLMDARSGVEAARLAREAEVGARVRHENLVSILDVGVDGTRAPYVVMELVEGGSLEQLRPKFGEEPRALHLLADVVRGLSALHRENVVHRDVKPANVLLRAGEKGLVAKVADFGIARPLTTAPLPPAADGAKDLALLGEDDTHRPATPAPSLSNRELTAQGALMGTPFYMAPEGALGAQAYGPPSDVYSFGVMAYELLTGTGPYPGVPIFDALAKKSSGERKSLDRARLGERLAGCLERCVALEPAERPTMAQVLETFERSLP